MELSVFVTLLFIEDITALKMDCEYLNIQNNDLFETDDFTFLAEQPVSELIRFWQICDVLNQVSD